MPFDSPDENLGTLLQEVANGKVQLPDFQREWKWDTDRIGSLLASISLDYPVGVLMMLEVGGSDVSFKPRPIAGVPGNVQAPDKLLLDGQQRITSLFQSLKANEPVATTDPRNSKRLQRWYYADINRCLDPNDDREEAILAVPEDRLLRTDFGRVVKADYSTTEKECAAETFPLRRSLDAGATFEWQNEYLALHPEGQEVASAKWLKFYNEVLKNFVHYTVPVIVLKKETPKEAVCTVFEKVNTGGVVLNVFELLTATFAAGEFRLNDDWKERKARLARKHVLQELQNTDFLQAVSLVSTYRKRTAAENSGVPSHSAPPVSCRRKDILRLTLDDYKAVANDVTRGFEWAAEFLAREKIFRSKDAPYRTQMVPLAALHALLGQSIDSYASAEKLRRWFWCGVLGELYGGAAETRFARDVEGVTAWLTGGSQPRTIGDASFEASRLYTLRTRNSAAYKGLHALLMKRGARDWMKVAEIDQAAFFDLHIDIHHVFPRKWCDDNGVDPGERDSIVNKTPLSWDTNRSIGGRSPASYLKTIEGRNDWDAGRMREVLGRHLVDGETLEADDFEAFYRKRKERLVEMIASAMGKEVARDDRAPSTMPEYEEEVATPQPDEELAAALVQSGEDGAGE